MTAANPAGCGKSGAGARCGRSRVFRCISPDGRLAVVEDTSKVLRLVEIETGRILARLESPDQQCDGVATFSPDGSRLVVTTNEPPCVHVWDLRAIRRRLGEMGLDWDQPPYPALPPVRGGLHFIRDDERVAEAEALCSQGLWEKGAERHRAGLHRRVNGDSLAVV